MMHSRRQVRGPWNRLWNGFWNGARRTIVDRIAGRGAMSVGAALLLGVTAVAGPMQDGSGDDAAVLRHYYSGNGLLNRGLYDLAAAEYRQFLDDHPEHEKAAVARYGLGVCLYRTGEHAAAIRALTGVADTPGFTFGAEARMIEGRCHLQLGAYGPAAEALATVRARHADHALAADATALHAEALYGAGRYADVAEARRALAERWPEAPLRARAELFGGLAAMALGQNDEAVARFDDLLAQDASGPYAGQASLLRAQALHRARRIDDAAVGYQQVIDAGVGGFVADALYGLAAIRHQQGRYGPAAELLDRVARQYPTAAVGPAATLLRGRVWFDAGDFEQATARFADLLEAPGPYQDDAAYWTAKCELRSGKANRAARRLARALETHPDSDLAAEMLYDRGVALLQADEPDEASEAFASFRTKHGAHALAADALQALATIEHQSGRYEASQQFCSVFAQQYPEHRLAPAIAFLAAENTFLTGDHTGAVPAYEAFLAAHGDDERAATAGFRLGMALHQLDRFDEARPHLEAAAAEVAARPAFRSALLALGDGHFQAGRWAQARRHLTAYLEPGDDVAAGDDALLKLGLAAQREGDAEIAVDTYDRLLAAHPESALRLHATFERGQALIDLDRTDDAVEAFEAVVAGEASSFLPHALNHLGVIALRQGDARRAAARFGQVAETAGDDVLAADALYRQGQALFTAGETAGAEAVFTQLLDAHPDFAEIAAASARRAITLARLGRNDDAIASMDEVEAEHVEGLDPALHLAMRYERAWCLRRLERPDEASGVYREVIRTGGESRVVSHAMLELAELEMNAGRPRDAADLLAALGERLGDDGPEDLREQAAYRHGLAVYRLEAFDEASTLLASFITAFPESRYLASASLLCGEAFHRTGAHRRAIPHLQRVAERFAEDESFGPGLLRLGESHAALQQWDDSARAFDAYLKTRPDDELWFQAQFGLGWARENQGRYDQAIDLYRVVVDRHRGETAARAQFQIGECLYAQKQYEEAARELLRVDILYAYPKWSAAALYEAGRCLTALGDPAEARRLFEQVVTEHEQTEWADLARQRLAELARPDLPGRG